MGLSINRDPFEWWYSVTAIATRTGMSARTIKRAYLSGKFGGRPGAPEFQGREICGQMYFPWPAVARFLGVSPEADRATAEAWRVRAESELRRKVGAQ